MQTLFEKSLVRTQGQVSGIDCANSIEFGLASLAVQGLSSLLKTVFVFGLVFLWAELVSDCAFAQDTGAPVAVKDSKTKKDSSSSLKGMFSTKGKDENAPVYIKSDKLKVDSKERIFTYQGNVEVIRDDLRMTADIMIGKYSEGKSGGSKLEVIICEDNIVLTSGENMRASADRAVYHVPSAVVELTEGPELAREGNVLSADKITVFVDEDRSEAEGNVRVKVVKTEDSEVGGGARKALTNIRTGDSAEGDETK